MNPELVSPFELVGSVLTGLEREASARQLRMRVEVASSALGTIRTDRQLLRQILINLANHAISFTQADSIVVSLNAVPTSAGDQWTIDVTDTGSALDHKAHISEVEFDARSSAVYGAGDLPAVQRLAEQLGGTLSLLRSEPGQGGIFRLTIRPLPHTSVARPVIGSIPAEYPLAGLTILLAEDHADMQRAVCRLLRDAGATVESAHDGHEAVARARSQLFDVVLMDLRMPRLDGIEATRVLRSEGCRTPILALTADAAELRCADALRAGCNACLPKPFTLNDLAAALQTLRAT